MSGVVEYTSGVVWMEGEGGREGGREERREGGREGPLVAMLNVYSHVTSNLFTPPSVSLTSVMTFQVKFGVKRERVPFVLAHDFEIIIEKHFGFDK